MRIGITCYPTYGGSGVVATELGKNLANLGHEIHFVSYALPIRLDKFNERIFFHEVEMFPYPLFQYPPYDLALAAKMAEVATSANLNLFHVHYALPHAVSAWLAKNMMQDRELKIVTTLHGTDITLVGMDKTYFPVTKFGILKSDGVTTVSKYLRDVTQNAVGRDDVEVIPNFVDTEFFKKPPGNQCRKSLAQKGEAVLLHISNFRPVKRVMDVIEIFRRVVDKHPTRLVLVGDGPERSPAEELCRKYKISDKVAFLGRQDNVPELLSCADVMLLPSELESFGLAALEAMSCEVPVVATNVGGLPEVIVHGETGYMADIGDVDTMAEYAMAIVSDLSLRRKLGAEARRRAVDVYDQRKIVPLYEKYYEKILDL